MGEQEHWIQNESGILHVSILKIKLFSIKLIKKMDPIDCNSTIPMEESGRDLRSHH